MIEAQSLASRGICTGLATTMNVADDLTAAFPKLQLILGFLVCIGQYQGIFPRTLNTHKMLFI